MLEFFNFSGLESPCMEMRSLSDFSLSSFSRWSLLTRSWASFTFFSSSESEESELVSWCFLFDFFFFFFLFFLVLGTEVLDKVLVGNFRSLWVLTFEGVNFSVIPKWCLTTRRGSNISFSFSVFSFSTFNSVSSCCNNFNRDGFSYHGDSPEASFDPCPR